MTSPVPVNGYALSVGSAPNIAMSPIVAAFSPSSKNIIGPSGPFKIGQLWVDTSSGDSWQLVNLMSSGGVVSAVWSLLATSSGTVSVIGTPDQIAVSTLGGISTVSLTDGISIGSFQPISPPVGGLLVPGQVSIGSSLPASDTTVSIFSNDPKSLTILGTKNTADFLNNQYSIDSNLTTSPSFGLTSVFGYSSVINHSNGPGITTASSFGYYSNLLFNATTGTVTSVFNFFSDVGLAPGIGGVVSRGYGGYFKQPNYGTTSRMALYSDNMSIGSDVGTPPVNGLSVTGIINNLAVSPFNVVAADPSQNYVGISPSTQGTVLTSGPIGTIPSFEPLPAGIFEGVARYVVTPDLSQGGGFTSIQAAINQAVTDGASSSSPTTVWIWPGTYTENLILASFVNLSAAIDNGVVIEGNTSYTPSNPNDMIGFSNITFQTPLGGGAAFSVLGVNTCSVFFNLCSIDGTTGSAFEINNANVSFTCTDSSINASSGFKAFDAISFTTVLCLSCVIISTDVASTVQGSGSFLLAFCNVTDSYVLTATSEFFSIGTFITALGTLSCVDIGLSNVAIIIDCVQVSSQPSGYWVTGTGLLAANGITTGNSFLGSADFIDPGLTTESLKSQLGVIATLPASSNSITAGFGSITVGTPLQNTSNQDILVNICVRVSAATAATIVLGVDISPTPATNTVIPTFSTVTPLFFTFSAYVPSRYWLSVDTTGIITVTSATTQAMGI